MWRMARITPGLWRWRLWRRLWLQNRKRGYHYVNEISVRFTRLLEILDAKPAPEALAKGLEEHDAALADFKKFAGLK